MREGGAIDPPLLGIRVLELAQRIAGPGTGMYLADQGAEVIRIEPPDGGRDRPGGQTNIDSFLLLNRGKKSVVVDIRSEEGREIIHRLVRTADVMLVAWPSGQAKRRGYGYRSVQQINPRIVYASITGWGNKGPHAGDRGYDRLIQAYTGIMAARPAPDGTPLESSFYVADTSIPMYLCYGIMLALWTREKTGRGQRIETSQLEAQLAMQSIYLARSEQGVPYQGGRDVGTYRPSHTYRCQDGRYLVLAPLTKEERAATRAVLGQAGGLPEEALATLDPDQAHARIAPCIEGKPSHEWLSILRAAGVPHALVRSREELMNDLHMWENGMLVEMEDPVWGRVRMIAPPFRLSGHAEAAPGPAPSFGQHTEAVLGELGYETGKVEDLKARGVVVGAGQPRTPRP